MNKNLVIGHGLSLVAGLPLPVPVMEAATAAQARIDATLPKTFVWYAAGHLHMTVRALLRTRYRAAPPLERGELPADLPAFVADLAAIATASQPLRVRFLAPSIQEDGHVQAAAEAAPSLAWWTGLRVYRELDDEAERAAFHVSVGFTRPGDLVSPEVKHRVAAELPALGDCVIDSLWLVHYANRTLNRLHGKVRLALGRENRLTPARFMAELGLCDTA